MTVLLPLLVLIFSVPLLGRSADTFVSAASTVSLRYRVPPVIVGAVLIGFGTSLPEMLASVLAALDGQLDIAVGNVVGSNAANLTLVLGPAALLCAITFPPPVLRREVVLMLGSSLLLVALLLDAAFSRVDGLLLCLAMFGALYLIMRAAREGDVALEDEVAEYVREERTGRIWWALLGGLVGTVLGAYLLVSSATSLAERVGLTGGLVGVSLVAIGTSLPEMVTTYHAARRGEGELIVGNLLGSNVFNTLLVAGLAGVVGPGRVSERLAGPAVWTMLGVSVLVTVMAFSIRRVPKAVTPLLLGAYVTMLLIVA